MISTFKKMMRERDANITLSHTGMSILNAHFYSIKVNYVNGMNWEKKGKK